MINSERGHRQRDANVLVLTRAFALEEHFAVLDILCGADLLETGERLLLDLGVCAGTFGVRPVGARLARGRRWVLPVK